MIGHIKDGPCDACLRANASKQGPTGPLPTSNGLLYGDLYHCSVPALHGGRKVRLVTVPSKLKLVKTVPLARKSDAPEAIELILAWYNSIALPVTWCHFDCANELRAGGAPRRSRTARQCSTASA